MSLFDNRRSTNANRAFACVAALMMVVNLLPIMLHIYPAMVDYPNHMARMAIIEHLNESPLLQKFYAENERICPNLGMDIVVPALGKLGIGLEDAIRIFMGLTLVFIAAGAIALGYIFQGSTPWFTLSIFGILYSRYFIYGFLNYFFALGVALLTAAAWFRLRTWPVLIRILIFSSLTSVLIGLHLVAFGIYALAVGGLELHKAIRDRAWRRLGTYVVALQFILPTCLYFTQFAGPRRKLMLSELWGSVGTMLTSKIAGLVGIFASYDLHSGAVLTVVVLAILIFAVWRNKVTPLAGFWMPAALLAAAFLCLPGDLMGSAYLDRRIPIAAAFFLVPLMRLQATPQVLGIFIVGLTGWVGIRVVDANSHWTESERVFDRYRAELLSVAQGAKLFTYIAVEDTHMEFPPVRHIGGFAVVDRSAFIGNIFAMPAVCESVHLQPDVSPLQRIDVIYPPGKEPDWPLVQANFNYMILIYEADKPVYPSVFKPISEDGKFILLENTLLPMPDDDR